MSFTKVSIFLKYKKNPNFYHFYEIVYSEFVKKKFLQAKKDKIIAVYFRCSLQIPNSQPQTIIAVIEAV